MENLALSQCAVLPLRGSDNHASEMVSQLLFGEPVQVLEQKGTWARVKVIDDSYEGWVDQKQLIALPGYTQETLPRWIHILDCPAPVRFWSASGIRPMRLPTGGRLPADPEGKKIEFPSQWPFQIQGLPGDVSWVSDTKSGAASVFDYMGMYEGSPYLWGGRSTCGIDCSGFTQMVLRFWTGKKLPRDAWQQEMEGEKITWDMRQEGDMVFFNKGEGKVTHVGIVSGTEEIFHAFGWVRKDTLTPEGILNRESGEMTHRIVSIRRNL